MKKNKILITGGAGYIGSHAVKLFLKKGYEVVVFDNLSRGYKEAVERLKKFGRVSLVVGDLRQEKQIRQVFQKYKFEAVLHFAAFCSVEESMREPELYFENNTLGSFNLIRSASKAGVKKFIFSSTCATYGETEYVPVDEKHPQNPTNPYGESKFLVERMLKWYSELKGMYYVILRYFNVCGADTDGLIGDSKDPSVHLVQNVVRGAMDIEPFKFTCPKVKTPDGSPIRDYVDVRDLAEAHYLAFNYLEKGGESDVFNLGNGKGFSVKEIVTEVEKQLGKEIPKSQGKVRPGEYAKIYADPAKAKKILGWTPKKTLEDSVASLEKWYKKNPNGYKE